MLVLLRHRFLFRLSLALVPVILEPDFHLQQQTVRKTKKILNRKRQSQIVLTNPELGRM